MNHLDHIGPLLRNIPYLLSAEAKDMFSILMTAHAQNCIGEDVDLVNVVVWAADNAATLYPVKLKTAR